MKKIILGLTFVSLLLSGCGSESKGTINHFEDEFFIYDNTNNICTRTAKVDIVDVEGYYLIATDEFLDKCYSDKINDLKANLNCRFIIKQGTVKNWNSELMGFSFKNGSNPSDINERIEELKMKLY